MVENATDAIAQDEVIKFPNPKTLEMIGYSVEELAKTPFRAMVLERHRRRLRGEKPPSTCSFRVIDRDGEEL